MVSPFVADTSVRETRQSTMNSTNRPPKERFQMDGLSHLTKIADGRNQSREEKPAVSSEPKAKKIKASEVTGSSGESGAEIEKNDDGEEFFKLSEYRRLTVRTFKGKTLVDIREMYKDKSSGALKPGSKGISLTAEQWEVLKNNIQNVDEMVQKVQK
ncbi:hypothetical protein C347_00210 [Cryptococcus neoformans AD2-60a]|uniref:Transcriptional coactivator p15 (PC4) C-terminal domain-containing protein n=1 Tax=Cryptococcus neoformans Tu259-1 TaxID=1230072 RepID=A0A854QPV8_CRYNE|nr:hypothetical protein C347_00210 [Cryptococcus neoformans var. grubii AD2-60a]OWZ59214.1 hypothetical protein C353_00137 [Cryptococcus neoformans var. grubii AD1-83a]OXG30297.1 hypothetical protein C361_00130 [Cryptococcus neoformans var. grubii Tu259-1]OXG40412.1 hypothetical protein C360_00180 [Cryptococcus neoformans var. grubii Bt15]OXG41820.1 hypothetical protein C359_03236 [Cryptococcus neoformans var. grubii Bt120]OXG69373.1 hypothetical protein C351_00133 [Cryptococcus neoformans var